MLDAAAQFPSEPVAAMARAAYAGLAQLSLPAAVASRTPATRPPESRPDQCVAHDTVRRSENHGPRSEVALASAAPWASRGRCRWG